MNRLRALVLQLRADAAGYQTGNEQYARGLLSAAEQLEGILESPNSPKLTKDYEAVSQNASSPPANAGPTDLPPETNEVNQAQDPNPTIPAAKAKRDAQHAQDEEEARSGPESTTSTASTNHDRPKAKRTQ